MYAREYELGRVESGMPDLSSEIVMTGKSVIVFNQAVMVSHP